MRIDNVLIHSTSWKLFWWIGCGHDEQGLTIIGLNPFYIMETILIDRFLSMESVALEKSLNPFYIMETILIDKGTIYLPKEIEEVLIHSTSWKLFWFSNILERNIPVNRGLNPFYIMETILMKQSLSELIKKSNQVLIHSTSWKLFWFTPHYGFPLHTHKVLIHSTSWKLFWSRIESIKKGIIYLPS